MRVALLPADTLGILMASSPAVTLGLTLATGSIRYLGVFNAGRLTKVVLPRCWASLPKEWHRIGLGRAKKGGTGLLLHSKDARLISACETRTNTANRL